MLRAGERLRDAADERFISRRKALLHQRRIAADKIDANRLRSAFKRESVFNRISPARSSDHRNRGDGNTLVAERDAELPLDLLTRAHKALRPARDFLINAAAGLLNIRIAAIEQRDAHGDGADIEILLLDHRDGLQDIPCVNHM